MQQHVVRNRIILMSIQISIMRIYNKMNIDNYYEIKMVDFECPLNADNLLSFGRSVLTLYIIPCQWQQPTSEK